MPELSIMQRLLRERALSRYVTALERGDLDTLASIMQRAEHDAALETMIFELHATYQSEEDFLKLVQEEHEMDFKGVHKSAPRNRLFASESESTPEAVPNDTSPASEPGSMLALVPPLVRRKPARWVAALAAILVVCVVGGGFLAAHIWQSGQTSLASRGPAPESLCLAPASMMPPGMLRSMSGLAENDVWAIGNDPNQNNYSEGGIILHWDGAKWNTILQANDAQDFNDIVEVAPNDVWMVGNVYPTEEVEAKAFGKSASTLIEHWDGVHWQTVSSPNGPGLYSILATSADDIWALGDSSTAGGVILYWDGRRWNSVPNPIEEQDNKNTFDFTGMKVFAANDVWVTAEAVSTDLTTARTMILHWNGTQWQTLAQDTFSGSSYTRFPFTFDGTSDDDLWFVEGVQIKHWNGKKWSAYKPTLPKNSEGALSGITALGSTDIWAIGQWDMDQEPQPFIEHWNGHQWQIVPTPRLISGLGGGVYMIGRQLWITSSFANDDRSSPYSTQIAMPCK